MVELPKNVAADVAACPGLSFHTWMQVVKPSFSTLLADPAFFQPLKSSLLVQ